MTTAFHTVGNATMDDRRNKCPLCAATMEQVKVLRCDQCLERMTRFSFARLRCAISIGNAGCGPYWWDAKPGSVYRKQWLEKMAARALWYIFSKMNCNDFELVKFITRMAVQN